MNVRTLKYILIILELIIQCGDYASPTPLASTHPLSSLVYFSICSFLYQRACELGKRDTCKLINFAT